MEAHQFLNDIPSALAVRAFQGTSFSPDKRGESYRNDYAQTLAEDYAELTQQAAKGGTLDKVTAAFARYRAGYAKHYQAWLGSHGRCISWMITGPSNFPTRRAQKWSAAADSRMQALIDFRERAKRAALRELRPDLRPIMAGDADAIERLSVELATLEHRQENMKKANGVIRKNASRGHDALVLSLVEIGIAPDTAAQLVQPGRSRGWGFASYSLSNNSANIRRIRARLQRLEKMRALPCKERLGEGVRIEEDPPANRVRLFFEDKPDAATRESLKSTGFRWTPSMGAWQATLNQRSLTLARSFAVI